MSTQPLYIASFEAKHIPQAARLFVDRLEELDASVSDLRSRLVDPAVVEAKLSTIREGFVALSSDRVVGYLTGWFPIDAFRDSARTGAYVPAWAHAAVGTDAARIYRALYRANAERWTTERCDVHALTLLASDVPARDAWFWNGFGLGTVDGVRSTDPLGITPTVGFRVRQGRPEDVHALVALDAEHVLHYERPPVLMAPRVGFDREAWLAFLAQPLNTAWVAEDDAEGPFGFIRFDRDFDNSDVAATDEGVFISGAFVRPSNRRRGVAASILDAALQHYRAHGVTTCAVDFEAFNPEAAAFWTRWFTPVCYSLMRVPEATIGSMPE